jgi:hypothetical protein
MTVSELGEGEHQEREPGEAVSGPPVAAHLAALIRTVLRDELDGVLPHIVAALKRDQAFTEISERLRAAEQLLSARRERPTAVAILRVLHRLRHLELEETLRESLDLELVGILNAAGFEECGAIGEPFAPDWHEPLEGRTSDGKGIVAEVYASGLSSFGDIIVRAQVRVTPPVIPVQAARTVSTYPISGARIEEP